MLINGIETLVYGVSDLAESVRFFDDFGLARKLGAPGPAGAIEFELPDGSHVEIRDRNDPALPASPIVGDGVREVVWGVPDASALSTLVSGLEADRKVTIDTDGTARFLSDFGVPMALRRFSRRAIVSAPDPLNSPDRVNRLNQHRKWRRRARPSVISHVVFAVPGYERAAKFMRDRLHFRLSDSQQGFGKYLRADGTTAHHSILLLNASAPIPGMDGELRFHHANFGVEDIDEIMIGANYMTRQGWPKSHLGLGRHRIDSALFYYLPCPAGGEAEYGADADAVNESWVPRHWTSPLFAYAQFVSNLPPFLAKEPEWGFHYLTSEDDPADAEQPREISK